MSGMHVGMMIVRSKHGRTHALEPRPFPVLTERKPAFVNQEPDEDYGDLKKYPLPRTLPSSGAFKAEYEKMSEGVWPWAEGTKSKLPEHYKRRFMEKFQVVPRPVHYKPNPNKWEMDKYGDIHPVKDIPMKITYPKEAAKGLWGGEGIVIGYEKNKTDILYLGHAASWKPTLIKRVFYSEILDKHMAITCTRRTLDLVDECYGFDHYILSTHEVDLRSQLGMILKREMLAALVNGDIYPEDPKKREQILSRYEQYKIPIEEVEWIGLSLTEATRKQEQIMQQARDASVKPLKYKLAAQLLEKLRQIDAEEREEEASKSTASKYLDKINPFKKPSSEN